MPFPPVALAFKVTLTPAHEVDSVAVKLTAKLPLHSPSAQSINPSPSSSILLLQISPQFEAISPVPVGVVVSKVTNNLSNKTPDSR